MECRFKYIIIIIVIFFMSHKAFMFQFAILLLCCKDESLGIGSDPIVTALMDFRDSTNFSVHCNILPFCHLNA